MRPLLTIAIPTFNRASYLDATLAQLGRELARIDHGSVEILVSDNASTDDTAGVVSASLAAGLPLRSVRNPDNIGSDANIAQCYNLASGEYLLILGDDDLLVDGCLKWLHGILAAGTYGVISLRAYGFDRDFRLEFPGGRGGSMHYTDASEFLAAVNSRITLISSNVIRKGLAPELDARMFCGGNLVQVHLVMEIALRASANLRVEEFKIACKRNNSGGYSFSRVFVEEFGRILDQFRAKGLSDQAIEAIERHMIVGFLPFYMLRQCVSQTPDLENQARYLKARFNRYVLFWVWLYPIIALPRPLAIAWGYVTTAIGRASKGDLRRGLYYVYNRLRLRY